MTEPLYDLPAELVSLAARLARSAGDLVATGRRSGSLDVGTKSTAVDLVTQWDTASERHIVEGLRQHRPDDGLVGEEGARHTGSSGIEWHVDPIDGTTNFAYGLPGYAVSIGAVDQHGPLAGAVYLPATRELFTAARGRGAHLGSRRLRVSTPASLAETLVATGFSYSAELRAEQGRRVALMLPHVRDIRRLGAAAADLCHVAAGRMDAYFEEALNSWDMVAGLLIAIEAGAVATDFSGGPARPAELVVGTPSIHGELRELITRCSS